MSEPTHNRHNRPFKVYNVDRISVRHWNHLTAIPEYKFDVFPLKLYA